MEPRALTEPTQAFVESALYLDSAGEAVFALHTAPRVPRTDLGVVLAHSGANNFSSHRSGVWTSICRQLATEGIPSLRFDFAGTGESSGEFVPGIEGQPVLDSTAAMDALRALGSRRLLVVGSCFGGLPSAVASVDRTDVAGFIMLSPPLVLPASSRASRRDRIREVANRSTLRAVVVDGDYRRWFFARLASLAKTRAALAVSRGFGRRKEARTPRPGSPAARTGGMLLEAELARLVAVGCRLEIVYGSQDESLERVERSSAAIHSIGAMRREPNVVWTVLDGSVHGLEDVVVQERLIRLVVDRAVALSRLAQ